MTHTHANSFRARPDHVLPAKLRGLGVGVIFAELHCGIAQHAVVSLGAEHVDEPEMLKASRDVLCREAPGDTHIFHMRRRREGRALGGVCAGESAKA